MYKRINSHVLVTIMVIIIFASLACSGLTGAAPTATSAPTLTSEPPTATVAPTLTPRPTSTPNIAATQEMEDAMTKVGNYVERGYLPSGQGELWDLDDASFDMAKINYLDFQFAGYEEKIKDFAVWTDLKVSSAAAVNYPEYSGCGFTFHLQDNGDAYTAMVTKDRVLLTSCRNTSCWEVGKTRGSGRLSYGNQLKATMELIVNDVHSYVLVDGQLIGEYTLSSDLLTDPGYFAYAIISGTNQDYGTRCEFANTKLWVPNE